VVCLRLGFNTYAAGTWFARDPGADRIYIYREFYENAMPVSQQAETILMLDKTEMIRMRLADPSIWVHHGNVETGENVSQIFEKVGLNFQPANNDRKAGKNIIHEMLAPAADGLPRLQVFSSCTNTIRTIPALPYDKNRPEDIDTRAEDHIYDTWRYGLINQRPAVSPKISTTKRPLMPGPAMPADKTSAYYLKSVKICLTGSLS
jgi:hypothetical protein